MVVQIYTDAELLAKIKDLDTRIEKAVTQSAVDDTMSKSEFRVAIGEMRKQRQMYYEMYVEQLGDESAGNIISMLPAEDWIC